MENVARRQTRAPRPRVYVSVNTRWITPVLIVGVLVYNTVRFYKVATTEDVLGMYNCGLGFSDSPFVVPLTNFTKHRNGSLQAGDWLFPPKQFWTEDGVTRACPCKQGISCMLKCCPLGQSIVFSKDHTCDISENASKNMSDMLSIVSSSSPLNTIKRNSSGPILCVFDNIFCDAKAGVFGSHFNPITFSFHKGFFIGSDMAVAPIHEWCIDRIHNSSNFLVLTCAENTYLDNWETTQDKVYCIINLFGFFLSSVCLMVSVVVYSVKPIHKNLHGMLLLSYFVSLALYYIVFFSRFITSQYFYEQLSYFVRILFYFEDILSIAFVSWLTVVCFNMWLVFGGPLKPRPFSHSDSKYLKYSFYSVIGWGIPIITGMLKFSSLICVIMLDCEFQELFYFTKKYNKLFTNIPGTTMLEINIVMFLSMLCHLRNQFRQNKLLSGVESQTRGQAKESIILYLKLALTTGINWALMRIFLSGELNGFHFLGCITVTLFHYQGLFLFLILTVDKSMWDSTKTMIMIK